MIINLEKNTASEHLQQEDRNNSLDDYHQVATESFVEPKNK